MDYVSAAHNAKQERYFLHECVLRREVRNENYRPEEKDGHRSTDPSALDVTDLNYSVVVMN